MKLSCPLVLSISCQRLFISSIHFTVTSYPIFFLLFQLRSAELGCPVNIPVQSKPTLLFNISDQSNLPVRPTSLSYLDYSVVLP